jgi:hypothetical protein
MTLQITFLFTANFDSLSVSNVARTAPLFNGAYSIGQNENQHRVASVAQSVRELATVPLQMSHLLSIHFFPPAIIIIIRW